MFQRRVKLNYIGIAAAILAFISLALPWWTMAMSGAVEFMEIEETMSWDVSVYTYDARMNIDAMGLKGSESVVDGFSLWYGYAALALIVMAGVAGIVGSLIIGKNGKMILVFAGILALLSILIFAVGLQNELSEAIEPGFPEVSLFSSGSWSFMGVSVEYSTYLSFGFWMALVAAIVAFVSLGKHPMVPPAPESS